MDYMVFERNPRGFVPHAPKLAPVMLAVLLISVGVGYLTVRLTGPGDIPPSQARAGAKILTRIREQGLVALWGSQQVVRRYVGEDPNARARAKLNIWRRPAADGYVGGSELELPNTKLVDQWSLAGDARGGVYDGPMTARQQVAVIIRLENGTVRVSQVGLVRQGRIARSAKATAPDNYIPEGTMHLVIRQVAASGQPAAFRTILNSEAIVNGQVRFADLRMLPQPDGSVQVMHYGWQSQGQSLYHLDDDGRIVRIEDKTMGVTFHLEKAQTRSSADPPTRPAENRRPSPQAT